MNDVNFKSFLIYIIHMILNEDYFHFILYYILYLYYLLFGVKVTFWIFLFEKAFF